jgi:hypothetical protein
MADKTMGCAFWGVLPQVNIFLKSISLVLRANCQNENVWGNETMGNR